VKFRAHRGGLKESMQTVREIEPSLTALSVLLKASKAAIKVVPLCHDDRNDWDTHLVIVDGNAVGFTDGMPA
jgi:hypothetical protein